MIKKKKQKSDQSLRDDASCRPASLFPERNNRKVELTALLSCILISLGVGIGFVAESYRANGYLGFPLDDSWIHLTFAKNLIAYKSFSYFRNEVVTAGSTSPLYTFLVGGLWGIWRNEFIISYAAGLTFMGVLVFYVFRLARRDFRGALWVVVLVTLVVAIQPRLNLISVSGMETTLFIGLICAGFYYYRAGRPKILGVVLGLLIWCRPDGLAVWAAIGLDYLAVWGISKKEPKEGPDLGPPGRKGMLYAFLIGLGITVGYFVFNYCLSGTILPNTYQAKLTYYQANPRLFFLQEQVFGVFSSQEFRPVWLPFIFGVLVSLWDGLRRRYNPFTVYVLFIFIFVLLYFLKLPFAHRFGRYLMPVIPFYLMIAINGLVVFLEFLNRLMRGKRTFIAYGILGIFGIWMVVLNILGGLQWAEEFTFFCRYHHDRHEMAGRWIRNHTPPEAVIGAHDVGAIGFYGERKVVDMVGLITPEVISRLNEADFPKYIVEYLSQCHVSYIVVLKNWFEVVNDNPVFIPINEPEFLEIYRFGKTRTHFQPREVSAINGMAQKFLMENQGSDALRVLERSRELDPGSSRTALLIGFAYDQQGNLEKAEQETRNAIGMFPEYAEAWFELGRLQIRGRHIAEGKESLKKCIAIKPEFRPAYELLVKVEEAEGKITEEGRKYKEKLKTFLSEQH